LTGDDALAALKRKALKISTESYVFSVRNEATKVVQTWKPSVGVQWFSTAAAEPVEFIRMQIKVGPNAGDTDWGSDYVRQKGGCHWVNALLPG
jgi:hypothetical protein